MTYVCHYELTASVDGADRLQRALAALVAAVRELPGWEHIAVYSDPAVANRFILIEHWREAADHDATATLLDPALRDEIQAAMDSPPVGGALTLVASG